MEWSFPKLSALTLARSGLFRPGSSPGGPCRCGKSKGWRLGPARWRGERNREGEKQESLPSHQNRERLGGAGRKGAWSFSWATALSRMKDTTLQMIFKKFQTFF